MRFSIIIPTHDRKNTLRRCLTGATSQDYPDYEVIVVDDGSTDGTGEMVRGEFPQVRYIRQKPNRGPAVARNQGIEAATGEIIAFTDDDCLLPPDFLSRLADGYRRYPEVAGVGGYLEAPDDLLCTNPFVRYEALCDQSGVLGGVTKNNFLLEVTKPTASLTEKPTLTQANG